MKISILHADDEFRSPPFTPHFSPVLDFRRREMQGHSQTFDILLHHNVKHPAGGGGVGEQPRNCVG
jgi:hypothetical protein